MKKRYLVAPLLGILVAAVLYVLPDELLRSAFAVIVALTIGVFLWRMFSSALRLEFTALVALFLLAPTALALWPRQPAQNPDPNHTHADFAVWIDGTQWDFSTGKYMSGSSTDESTHPTEGPRQYFHLHDGNGHVIHRHKPGLAVGQFFQSVGFAMTPGCLQTDTASKVCDTAAKKWRFFVNGAERPYDAGYVFNDGDHLLWTYGAADADLRTEMRKMTDDGCKYSKTCPWKGAPPTESCIADPTVPCRVP
jgi:hypothetical protein